MTRLQEFANNAAMVGGTIYPHISSNGAVNEQGLQKTYLENETKAYISKYGSIADNVYETESQGIDTENWYAYVPVKIRVAPVIQPTSGGQQLDDWKRIKVIAPRNIDYISQGALMQFQNSWWIVYKPHNIPSYIGDAIIRRCNAVINRLDYYGNIVSIPLSYARLETSGNAPQIGENTILSKNYINCICQRNKYTKDFRENTRIVLGSSAYTLRGINDFTREFTDDPESVHFMTFAIERTEALDVDSIEKQCADYNSFEWNINALCDTKMVTGAVQQILVISTRNGVQVFDDEEHPISYSFYSSDESILTVSNNGEVTAIGEGTATITVVLDQNENQRQNIEVTVSESSESFVAFTSVPVESLREFESAVISASYYENGIPTDDEVHFTFSGVSETAYGTQLVNEDGKQSVKVTCYTSTPFPMVVTAECNGHTAEMYIYLRP